MGDLEAWKGTLKGQPGDSEAVPAPVKKTLQEVKQNEKNTRIKKIMDDAAKLLEAEQVKYFIGVLDREKENPNQGRAFVQSDVTGDDMIHILDMALPTRQDAVNLGVYVGTLIKSRQKNNKKS